MTPDTLARLRADTPACARLIHFNNAGAALQPLAVTRAMDGWLAAERDMGGYEAEAALAPVLDGFYTSLARLIGAAPDEIAFAESATRAWDSAVHAIPWQAGDEVIVHVTDYGSCTLTLRMLAARRGVVVRVCPSDATGQIDVAALAAMIGPRTRLVALTHVPTNGGLVNPAEGVGRVTRDAGVLFLLDACQSLGQVPIDVGAIGCDMLSATGRKYLRGPRGTGVLYVARPALDRLEPAFIDGHSAAPQGDGWRWEEGARRFEQFERNFAGMAGMAAAADYALEIGMDRIATRLADLAASLRDRLAAIPGVTVRDRGARKGGIVTFTHDRVPAPDMLAPLRAQGINTSVATAHWAPRDFAERGLPPMLRASVHAYNTEEELDRFAAAIAAF